MDFTSDHYLGFTAYNSRGMCPIGSTCFHCFWGLKKAYLMLYWCNIHILTLCWETVLSCCAFDVCFLGKEPDVNVTETDEPRTMKRKRKTPLCRFILPFRPIICEMSLGLRKCASKCFALCTTGLLIKPNNINRTCIDGTMNYKFQN